MNLKREDFDTPDVYELQSTLSIQAFTNDQLT